MKKPLILLPFLLVTGLLLGVGPALAKTPSLPESLQQPDGKPVLLEFYAEWCTTCQRMIPVLHEIQDQAGQRLRLIRLDVEAPANESVARQFNVQGTPTYVVFDTQGEPLYKMDRWISSSLLRTMAYNAAGIIPRITLPGSIPQFSGQRQPYTLIEFHKDNCNPCRDANVYHRLLERQEEALKVAELNTRYPAVRGFMEQIGLESVPAYMIVDEDGYVWHLHQGALSNQDKTYLREYYQMIRKVRL